MQARTNTKQSGRRAAEFPSPRGPNKQEPKRRERSKTFQFHYAPPVLDPKKESVFVDFWSGRKKGSWKNTCALMLLGGIITL
jgi:hypothetical protein